MRVFEENLKTFPDDLNLFDSIAEGYAVKGDLQLAKRYYQRAAEKSPFNGNAIEILRHIR